MQDMRFSQPVVPVPKEKRIFFRPFAKKALKILGVILILVLVIAVIFLGKYIFDKNFKNNNQPYNAVFLTNGQLYFGKIEKQNDEQMVLKEVFYPQIGRSTTEVAGSESKTNQMTLARLDQQIHGPTNKIFINKSQILYYEQLRDDSKIVESIKNYK